MHRRTVAVASFVFPYEADMARFRLELEGIPSRTAGDAFVGYFWHYSNATGGVKVLVRDEDAARAVEILTETQPPPRRKPTPAPPASPEPQAEKDTPPSEAELTTTDRLQPRRWACDRCGARVPSDFEVCWACGADVEGQLDPEFQKADTPIPEYELDMFGSPWLRFLCVAYFPLLLYEIVHRCFGDRPVELARFRTLSIPLDPVLFRACRASLFALVWFPPFVLYSFYLLWRVDWGTRLQARRTARFCILASAINLLVVVYYSIFVIIIVWSAR